MLGQLVVGAFHGMGAEGGDGAALGIGFVAVEMA
jgi:hypothetical protein